jgi:hypothetical protein
VLIDSAATFGAGFQYLILGDRPVSPYLGASVGLTRTKLENLQRQRLSPRDDLRVGLALVDLYDRRMNDPGRAMVELRRMIDTHPEDRGVRRLRDLLAGFKTERFGTRRLP